MFNTRENSWENFEIKIKVPALFGLSVKILSEKAGSDSPSVDPQYK